MNFTPPFRVAVLVTGSRRMYVESTDFHTLPPWSAISCEAPSEEIRAYVELPCRSLGNSSLHPSPVQLPGSAILISPPDRSHSLLLYTRDRLRSNPARPGRNTSGRPKTRLPLTRLIWPMPGR